MKKENKKIIKDILQGTDLEMNLPAYANAYINATYEYSLIHLVLNYYTIKEIQDMSQRLEVAIMLRNGLNYQDISKQTGVSTATISRVSKCLNYGSGGYNAAIDKLNEKGETI